MMDVIVSNMSQWHWFVAIGVGCCAGFIKGVVGFAMPMVFIAGLSLIVRPELALAGLILPTLITNIWQAFAQGRTAAWQSVTRFRLFFDHRLGVRFDQRSAGLGASRNVVFGQFGWADRMFLTFATMRPWLARDARGA